MNIDTKALKGIVDEIEASRLRQKAETDHQREVMKRCKPHQLDTKAVRIVLQRRAMGDGKRDEQDYYVHAYEVALGGKKAAIEALENGATIREAADAGGISTGAAGNLAQLVQNSPFVDGHDPDTGEIIEATPAEPAGNDGVSAVTSSFRPVAASTWTFITAPVLEQQAAWEAERAAKEAERIRKAAERLALARRNAEIDADPLDIPPFLKAPARAHA